jgi:hypothetical protein
MRTMSPRSHPVLASIFVLALASGCDPAGKCDAPDESTRVDLTVELGSFVPPGETADGYRFDDLPCTVTAVDLSDAARVRTELDCDTASGAHAVVIEHAASDLGAPAWAADDALLLSIELRVYSDLNDIPLWAVTLRSPEGEPRLVVMDTDMITDDIAAPITLSLDEDACPYEGVDEQSRGRLSLSFDGGSTKVVDGNDGTFETSAGTWAVELEKSVSGDFGERSLNFELLVMKVQ